MELRKSVTENGDTYLRDSVPTSLSRLTVEHERSPPKTRPNQDQPLSNTSAYHRKQDPVKTSHHQTRALPAENKTDRSPSKTRLSAARQKQDPAQPAETRQPLLNTAQPFKKSMQGPRMKTRSPSPPHTSKGDDAAPPQLPRVV